MSKSRIISSLVWARRLDSRPKCIPKGRPRGAKAVGIRYQKAFGRAMGAQALDGPWFEFQDKHGLGYCQPDFLLEFEKIIVILECKYSWTPEAYAQIELLYRPVVEKALKKPTIGLQVAKRLVPEASRDSLIVSSLGNGMVLANSGRRVVLHWLENTPVVLRPSDDQIRSIQMGVKSYESAKIGEAYA